MKPTLPAAFLLALVQATAPAQTTWTQAAPVTVPPARSGATIAFEQRVGRLLLFGGEEPNGNLRHDLTAWDGTDWSAVSVTSSPPGWSDAGFASDGSGFMLAFGGAIDHGGGNIGPTDAAWRFDGAGWTRLPNALRPSAREGHSMAVDSRGMVIVFGGYDGNALLADTWEWDGANFRQLQPAASPPARSDAGMAFDSLRGRLVLFGGNGANGELADTWEWDGATWTAVASTNRPSARAEHGMVFDAAREVTVLFGGQDAAGASDETWEWNGVDWRLQAPVNRPFGRSVGHAIGYDPVRAKTVMFGGDDASGASVPDTWEYGPVWPATVRAFGAGCGTSLAFMGASLPWSGEVVEFQLGQLPRPAGAGFVMFGTSTTGWGAFALPLDLTLIGMPGCTAYTDLAADQPFRHANGWGIAQLGIPASPGLLGGRFYAQAVVPDSRAVQTLGIAMSAALELVIGSR